MCQNFKSSIIKWLKGFKDDEYTCFSFERNMIKNIFDSTRENIDKAEDEAKAKEHIYTRLALIDNVYSTQMSKRYYGLSDLTEALFELYDKEAKKQTTLSGTFIEYANKPSEDGDIWKLFNNSYGIGKDGNGMKAVSLLSKYAYFETAYKFPIYDSVVREVFPEVWKKCECEGESFSRYNPPIYEYITVINNMRIQLQRDKLTQIENYYNALDKLLWTIGEIKNKRLSLVLNKAQYKQYTDGSKPLEEIFPQESLLGQLVGLKRELYS